jgi:RNA polymerase sigma-70 factor (ECF subfamily)
MRETLNFDRGKQLPRRTDSFDAFCRHYLPVLERYLVCQARDSRWTSDIARDSMIAARGRWSALVTTGRGDCWLFEAATRELRRLEARARSRCQARDDRADVGGSADLRIEAGADSWVCDHLGVIRAVRSLPRRQAEVVGLHYLVGYSIADVARILGICAGTAGTQLDRGMASLARWPSEWPGAGGPAVAVTQDDLRAAGASIGVMPADDLNRRLRGLDQRRRSQTGLAELRRQSELDSAELERAAYLLAGKYRDEGDLVAAAQWYRMAAARDFSDASLELAKVLDRLARLAGNGGREVASDVTDLRSEATQWYGNAYAAGHLESAEPRDLCLA